MERRPHLLDRLREVGWEIVIIPEIDPVQDNLCALHSTTALPILGRVRRFLILIIDVRLDARSPAERNLCLTERLTSDP